jgi:hypothetical protein
MMIKLQKFNLTGLHLIVSMLGFILVLDGCLPIEKSPTSAVILPTAIEISETAPASLVTKTSPAQVYNESSSTFVYFDSCFDLDEGSGSAGIAPGCDLLVQADVEKSERIAFSPLQSARFAFDEPLSTHPQPEQCRASTHLSRDPEVIAPLLSSDYCYQTGIGRYGYLRFKEISHNGVLIEWHTFDTLVITPEAGQGTISTGTALETPFVLLTSFPTETIPPYWTHSEGFDRYLNFNFCFDLDNGEDNDNQYPACDFFIYHGPGGVYNEIEFIPNPPAIFTFWKSFDNPPGFNDCRRSPAYTHQVTTIAPLELNYICYQTGEGRFGYLRFDNTNKDVVSIDWHTFDPPLDLIEVPSNTVSPPTTDIQKPVGQAVWTDSFENGKNWTMYQDEHTTFTIKDGHLTMTALIADSWDGALLSWQKMSDFYLEAAFHADECSGLNNYGLQVRAGEANDSNNGYWFSVSCNGYFNLRRMSNGKSYSLIPWTFISVFQPALVQEHRLGFLAQGEQLVLFIDDQFLAEFEDETYPSGVFGPFISAVETPGFQIDVEQIASWALR